MTSAVEGRSQNEPKSEFVSSALNSAKLIEHVLQWLDEAKATDVITIDLRDKSVIGDYMVIASGGNERHVAAIADQMQRKLKDLGYGRARVEGQDSCDWVLIDIGEIVIHVFRPEVRAFYNLEKMWASERPADQSHSH